MKKFVDADIGEVKVAAKGTILQSATIGSRVVIAALNIKRKSVFMDIGNGLIHCSEGNEKGKTLRQVSQYN